MKVELSIIVDIPSDEVVARQIAATQDMPGAVEAAMDLACQRFAGWSVQRINGRKVA